MASTLSTLKTQLRAAMGGRTDKNAYLATWLNLAQERIARYYDFPELRAQITTFATVDGTKTYDLTSDIATNCKTILAVKKQTGTADRTVHVRYDWFDMWVPYPEGDSEGEPMWWWMADRTTIGFYPIPDDAYTLTIRYTNWSSDLVAETDTTTFLHMDDVIVAAAMVEFYNSIQEYRDSREWEATFDKRIKEAGSDANFQPGEVIVLGQFRPAAARPNMGLGPWEDPWYRKDSWYA